MVDYIKAIKRPFSDLRILAISCGLFLIFGIISMIITIPILILSMVYGPSFLIDILSILISLLQLIIFAPIYGYILYSAKLVMNKDFRLINWKNWKHLFNKGLIGSLIRYIYGISIGITIFILIKIFNIPAFDNSLSNNPELLVSQLPSFIMFFIIMGILILIFLYTYPMVEMMYIKNFKFYDAFKFKELFKKLFNFKWFCAWIMTFVIALLIILATFLIFGILIIIGIVMPLLFILIIPILIISLLVIIFAIMIMQYTIYAQVYTEIK